MKTLDRYLLRETIPPFLLALGLFTFLLAISPMLEQATLLLSKGVDLPTVGLLLLTLLPQAFGVTIPMAFLAGLLMALGRLSGDRETVALLACGVSPFRLLRPILVLGLIVGAANMYVLVKLVPDSNQRFREITYQLIAKQGESDIKPGVFYEGFPQKVLFVRGARPEGGWDRAFIADTSQPGRPSVTIAARGRLELDPANRMVWIVLPGRVDQYVPGEEEGVYDTVMTSDARFKVPPNTVYGDGNLIPGRGKAEMGIAELRAAEAAKVAAGAGLTKAEIFARDISPHPEILQRHQMFSFPVACLVFAVIGMALGLHTRKEGKLDGFTLGLAVIFAYYALMAIFEDLTKGGRFPAEWARWMPNILLGLVAVWALRLRSRSTGGDFAIRVPGWMFKVMRRFRGKATVAGNQTSGAMTTPAGAAAGAAGGLTQPDPSGASRVVLVIRFPELRLPRPRLLDLYVSRRYLNIALLSFFGLLAVYYIATFIDKSERLFKGQADAWMMAKYFWFSTPQFIVYVAPMAVLVSVLATIGGLTRTGELIVMRACGISLYRVAAPLVLLALVWSGGLFLLDDRVLAHANRRAEALDSQIRGGGAATAQANSFASTNWLADRDGRIYYYSVFDIPRRTLHGLSIFEVTPDGTRLASHTMVGKAVFANGAWQTSGGWTQKFLGADRSVRETFGVRRLALEPPDRFSGLKNQESELMTYGDLRRHVADLRESGVNLAESQVQLQQRIAFPLVTIVMTILGLPFGITMGRRGALYGVGLAFMLGAGYWLLNTFFLAVGQAGLLPPVMAAWAANVLFLAGAVYATLTVRT